MSLKIDEKDEAILEGAEEMQERPITGEGYRAEDRYGLAGRFGGEHQSRIDEGKRLRELYDEWAALPRGPEKDKAFKAYQAAKNR